MNMMKSGSDWLMGKLKSHAGTTISLRRAQVLTTGVTATVGSTQHNQLDDLGGIVYWESRDYLIDADDYVFTTASEPKRGDIIIETIDGHDVEFEVMGDGGATAWRWSDDYHTKYRVHTQRVKSG